MIESHELKNRDRYLKKLIGFQDTEPVKVITGIRRCGKSSLLKLMIRHLWETGIGQEQIVEMNFESHDFRSMTSDEVYHYVKEKAIPGKRMYLFFDELQRIDAWEDAVNSFRVDLDCDIYITGSNAYLLSSEYSTYLSGRCVEIKMLPLSFGSSWTSTTLKCGKPAAPWAELTGKCLIKTANAMTCGKCLTPICVLAGCLESRTSDWIRKKP